MADGDVLLDVREVCLALGGSKILHQVSFCVRDRVRPGVVTGQVVGLLGPSGVGKTRLLRILAGLDAPDQGQVLGPGGKPLLAGQVGLVFQNYPLLRHRSVLGNLVVAGTINGLGETAAQARARELLERFGLAERGGFYPAQLSGGQRQRVAVAQQLMRPRSLLLLDEPFSGLDPAALGEVLELIAEVAHMDERNTVIIVTHDIRAAILASDTLLMLGREAEPGEAGPRVVPGARIRHSFDLVERGLAWQVGVEEEPRFAALERELKALFGKL